MLKKALTVVLLSAAGGGLLLGSEAVSYLKTFGGSVQRAVRSEISPEFELQRLQDEVAGLMPEVRNLLRTVAEQSVDLRDLDRQIEEREQNLEQQQAVVLALRDELATDKDVFICQARTCSREEVQQELEHRFDAFCRLEETVSRDRQIRAALQGTLRTNQSRLDTVLSRREELNVEVAQLEHRLRQVEAAEEASTLQIDDTRFAAVESMIRRMNHDLDVRESILESEGRLLSRLPDSIGNPTDKRDILAAVDEHFSDQLNAVEEDTMAAAP